MIYLSGKRAGDRYEGQYNQNMFDGPGTYYWSSGDWYQGNWKMGKQDGKGVYVWADENFYDGEWKDGNRHGQGSSCLVAACLCSLPVFQSRSSLVSIFLR